MNYKYNYILLTVDKPYYRYEFNPNNPLVLGNEPEVGLKSIFLWYTYPNISSKYDNNTFQICVNNEWKMVTIPDGMYEIEHLSNFINKQVTNDGDYISLKPNPATFKCQVIINPDHQVKIDFSIGDLHKLLGLEPKIYENTSEGTSMVNITRGVDKIFIRCNVVNREFQYHLQDVLYDVLPYSEPGAVIQERFQDVEFYQCKDKIIRHLEIKVTDSKGNLLEFSEPFAIKLVFRHQP